MKKEPILLDFCNESYVWHEFTIENNEGRLWNFFADTAIEPVIELGKEYSKIEFINCDGRLEGDKVYLSDIQPFGFVAFEVK